MANALYLADFNVFFSGSFNESSHFWTLSVEEQFYLIWFPIAIIAPLSLIKIVLFATIVFSFLFQIYAKIRHVPMSMVLPITSADVPCSGALLAIALRFGGRSVGWMAIILSPKLIVPTAALVVADYLNLIAWMGVARIVVMPVLVTLCLTDLVRYSL